MPDFIDLSTYARMGQAEASRKKKLSMEVEVFCNSPISI
jgi:hypothetical protein